MSKTFKKIAQYLKKYYFSFYFLFTILFAGTIYLNAKKIIADDLVPPILIIIGFAWLIYFIKKQTNSDSKKE
ncbi:MAG: hypothetical protein LBM27_00430 [Lactobacillaceae bacterium]|jgi:hypothetical protein|nr:hypothetical protein [Lactobacillaceae bacterium]